jgi:uncharacterized protein
MVTCGIVLHGDLPDLVGGRRTACRRLPRPTAIGDALEALGLPHGEIGRVLLDGEVASLRALLVRDHVVAVWPAEPRPLTDPRFVCDQHLGKLARLLRFCGFDTLWDPTLREASLARLAITSGRTVLSRHRALLKRRLIASALLVRSDHADRQLTEVLRRFELAGHVSRPGRCPTCNGNLVALRKDAVRVPIPPRTAAWRDDYWLCDGCGQLFWEGTHVQRLQARVAAAVRAATA